MLEGNPDTALKDPYSIVLTETAAKKLFGNESALGKAIKFDTLDYLVTGVMKDVPFFSHINFEALVSVSTAELLNKNDKSFEEWTSMWSNYVYLLLPENADMVSIQSQLDAIAKEENLAEDPDGYQDTRYSSSFFLYIKSWSERISLGHRGLLWVPICIRLCFGYWAGLHSL
jgi:hypothetical protein